VCHVLVEQELDLFWLVFGQLVISTFHHLGNLRGPFFLGKLLPVLVVHPFRENLCQFREEGLVAEDLLELAERAELGAVIQGCSFVGCEEGVKVESVTFKCTAQLFSKLALSVANSTRDAFGVGTFMLATSVRRARNSGGEQKRSSGPSTGGGKNSSADGGKYLLSSVARSQLSALSIRSWLRSRAIVSCWEGPASSSLMFAFGGASPWDTSNWVLLLILPVFSVRRATAKSSTSLYLFLPFNSLPKLCFTLLSPLKGVELGGGWQVLPAKGIGLSGGRPARVLSLGGRPAKVLGPAEMLGLGLGIPAMEAKAGGGLGIPGGGRHARSFTGRGARSFDCHE
jgi:hypothetical protein